METANTEHLVSLRHLLPPEHSFQGNLVLLCRALQAGSVKLTEMSLHRLHFVPLNHAPVTSKIYLQHWSLLTSFFKFPSRCFHLFTSSVQHSPRTQWMLNECSVRRKTTFSVTRAPRTVSPCLADTKARLTYFVPLTFQR